MKFILTVPHARCPVHSTNHDCDIIALDVANALDSYLFRHGIGSYVYPGSVPRTECDLNRRECRRTKWYGTVFHNIRPSDILIDVHSFDRHAPRFNDNDIVLYKFHDPSNHAFVREILDHIPPNDLLIATMEGNEYNSIVMDALSVGCNAVLMEFNEKHRGNEGMLASVIGNSLVKIAKFKHL